ncbi:hypothetical protein [Limnochorda pilosa]|uniref:Uncharacterized protein n=1 Tax=Limnochorda pilosa TaxID=1555112 RepID=A0A0K2SG70_LIMPI|nr:hypothetical protein [Limnochorda pilosa]BAS26037.1 hypothetical protein LIP_0180 [Limnochorda pilosa]
MATFHRRGDWFRYFNNLPDWTRPGMEPRDPQEPDPDSFELRVAFPEAPTRFFQSVKTTERGVVLTLQLHFDDPDLLDDEADDDEETD